MSLAVVVPLGLGGCGGGGGDAGAGPSAQASAEDGSGLAGTSREPVRTDEGTERALAGLPVGLFPIEDPQPGCLGVNVTLSGNQQASLVQVDLAGDVTRRAGACGDEPECPSGGGRSVPLDEGRQTCSLRVNSDGGQAQARVHVRISCDSGGAWCPEGGLKDAAVFADTPVTDVLSTSG